MILGVIETALYVDDLERATAFYRDVLGLTVMQGDLDRFQALATGPSRLLPR
jgi:catechol 2,3-dioxygenase-like lactoylglutathione lyase family enzyme